MNTVSPESVGFSSERLKRVDQVMQKYVDQGKLPGVLSLVARRGQVAHLSKVGWMDVEAKKPIAFDTLFRIYSMTKPITSVAVMMLYEEGRFFLGDPVAKYIPEFEDVKVLVRETETGVELANLQAPDHDPPPADAHRRAELRLRPERLRGQADPKARLAAPQCRPRHHAGRVCPQNSYVPAPHPAGHRVFLQPVR